MSLRTNFHSSKFTRCLADLALVDSVEPDSAFAEKLGLWIHFTEAITLSAVHGEAVPAASGPRPGSKSSEQAGAELKRVQTLLTNSITRSCSPGPSKAHITLPEPILALPLDIAAAYVPYRRFYDAHQRDMDMNIQPLRVNVRDIVAKSSPRLNKLAELDFALDKILRERETKLLATVPVLLRKRFEHLFNGHQQRLAETGQADNPSAWMAAGGWLSRFCNDMQILLLAELELRLQPTLGLIEALNNDTRNE